MPYAPSSATKTITVVAPKQQPSSQPPSQSPSQSPSQPSIQPTPGTPQWPKWPQWQLPKQPIWMWIALAGVALIGIGIILLSFRK